jgi:hypothetical protein
MRSAVEVLDEGGWGKKEKRRRGEVRKERTKESKTAWGEMKVLYRKERTKDTYKKNMPLASRYGHT